MLEVHEWILMLNMFQIRRFILIKIFFFYSVQEITQISTTEVFLMCVIFLLKCSFFDGCRFFVWFVFNGLRINSSIKGFFSEIRSTSLWKFWFTKNGTPLQKKAPFFVQLGLGLSWTLKYVYSLYNFLNIHHTNFV